MPAMLMEHSEDPADVIRKRVGDALNSVEVFGGHVLIAIYERPKITRSGIHLADVTVQEDQWQGKCGLVLSTGPAAFTDSNNYTFAGQKVEVGDWVAIFVSDGRKLTLQNPVTGEKQLCRLVEDEHIRLRITAPDVVW